MAFKFHPTEEEAAQLAALKAQIAERKPIDDLSPGERQLLEYVLREMTLAASNGLGPAEKLVSPLAVALLRKLLGQ